MTPEQSRIRALEQKRADAAKEKLDRVTRSYASWQQLYEEEEKPRMKAVEEDNDKLRAALTEIADTFEIDWHEAQVIAREALGRDTES